MPQPGTGYPRPDMDPVTTPLDTPVLAMKDVWFVRDGRTLLANISWRVRSDERWVVMGANGSGKTSLIRIAGLYEHPSSGSVIVAGETLGHTDVRTLRRRIALVSAAVVDMIRPGLICRDVVMSAKFAALEPWWHTYTRGDAERAVELLEQQGVGSLAERTFASLSTGQKQRVLLARALMGSPDLVLLDEPCTGLDLRAREELLAGLSTLADDTTSAPTVLVTHHVDEIPSGYSHLLLLKGGRIMAEGPLEDTLTAEALSATFEIPLQLERHLDGRWSARGA